jgi:hypothetical protein
MNTRSVLRSALAGVVTMAAAGAMAQVPPPPAAPSAPRAGTPAQADLDKQFKVMQDMHEKMAAAKTPAERQALMAEHMKVMQGGMAMMGRMGGMGMGPGGMGPGGMGPGGMGGGSMGPGGPQGNMEQRMRMMEHMMQMMMDRMAAPPAAQ